MWDGHTASLDSTWTPTLALICNPNMAVPTHTHTQRAGEMLTSQGVVGALRLENITHTSPTYCWDNHLPPSSQQSERNSTLNY